MTIRSIVSTAAWVLLLLPASHAFAPIAPARRSGVVVRQSTAAPSDVEAASDIIDTEDAKNNLLAVAKKLHAEHGIQLFQKAPKAELKAAVEELESLNAPLQTSQFVGDWTLLVTTAANREGVDATRFEESLPSYLFDPIKKIRSSILDVSNKYLVVQQKIKSTNDDGVVDRIDHTLELEPPAQLRDVLDNLPEQLMNVNINPLAVSKSKLVLVHKASMVEDDEEGSSNKFKTKISLQSIVLNVAGTSRVLDPAGKDVAGINIPSLGDFMNTADFETTYMDEDIRISRGKLGFVDQLRVFVRTEAPTTKVDISQEDEEEIVDIESAIADVDVQGIAEPDDVEPPSDVEASDDDSLTP